MKINQIGEKIDAFEEFSGIDRRRDTHRDDYKNRPWRKDAAPLNKAPSNPDYPTKPFNKDEWMKNSKSMKEGDIPVVGGTIRTKSGTEGKVTKIVGNEIFYTLSDGRTMKSHLRSVTPVQKLEDTELNEISDKVIANYKSAIGKKASAADASGDYDTGNKLYSKITQATLHQGRNSDRRNARK
ncbi:MAG TPA: hypothetical protein VIY47_10670, partial [Ignavibacteriaceae bacterium]